MIIEKDGDAYCVKADGFKNLQESNGYFFIDEDEYRRFMVSVVAEAKTASFFKDVLGWLGVAGTAVVVAGIIVYGFTLVLKGLPRCHEWYYPVEVKEMHGFGNALSYQVKYKDGSYEKVIDLDDAKKCERWE